MTDKQLRELDAWIAAEIFGWQQFRKEEYPHRMLWREGEPGTPVWDSPDHYTEDPGAALAVLQECMKHLDRLTGRTDFQIVVLYDEGSLEPWTVVTDSVHDEDDKTHIRNCSNSDSFPKAICLFARKLFGKEGE